MARNYTSIDHSALTSDTLADADDTTQALFWRLLCASDDWGRFPYNFKRLKRMMGDYSHTEKEIQKVVDYFIDAKSIIKYEIADLTICEWVKWDYFQTMAWKNQAKFPNRESILEGSTNPGASEVSKQIISYPILSNEVPPHLQGRTQSHKQEQKKPRTSSKKKPKPDGPPKYNPVSRWCDLWLESFGEKFIVIPADAKHITDAFKALKKDETEFENRVRGCFADTWFRENKPGVAYFYRNLNKFTGSKPLIPDDGPPEPAHLMKFNIDDETTWPQNKE